MHANLVITYSIYFLPAYTSELSEHYHEIINQYSSFCYLIPQNYLNALQFCKQLLTMTECRHQATLSVVQCMNNKAS